MQCILGLTATATKTTALSVASHLSVAEENIIRGCTVPSNLHITASCDENRDDVSDISPYIRTVVYMHSDIYTHFVKCLLFVSPRACTCRFECVEYVYYTWLDSMD